MGSDEKLGAVIRRAREREGFSLRQLATRTGVSAGQLSRIEAGMIDRPTLSTLIGIAHGLGRSPEALFLLAGHLSLEQAKPIIEVFLSTRPEGESFGVTVDEVRKLLQATRDLDEKTQNARQLRRLIGQVFIEGLEAPPLAHLLGANQPRLELDRLQVEFLASAADPESNRGVVDASEKLRLSAEFREVCEHWSVLRPTKQRLVLAHLRDQSRLAELEQTNLMLEDELERLRESTAVSASKAGKEKK